MYYDENGDMEYFVIIEDFYCKKFDELFYLKGEMNKDGVIHIEYEHLIKLIGEENKDKIASNLVIKEIEFVMECLGRRISYFSDEDKEYYLKNISKINSAPLYIRRDELNISDEQSYKIFKYLKGKERREKITKLLNDNK